MEIPLHYLLQKIPACDIIHDHINKSFCYRDIRLLYREVPMINEPVVYVGSTSFLPDRTEHLTECCLILRREEGWDFSSLRCDYLLLKDSVDIVRIYHALMDVYNVLENKTNLQFYTELIDCGSLTRMIELASRTLSCPILLAGNDGLIAYSGRDFSDDPSFSQLIYTGQTSPDHIQASHQEGIPQMLLEEIEMPLLIGPGVYRTRNRIFSYVRSGDRTLGYILALEGPHAFTASDIKQMSAVCNAAAYLVQQDGKGRNLSEALHQSYLRSLLEGAEKNTRVEWLNKWALTDHGRQFWVFAAQDSFQSLLAQLCEQYHTLSCHFEQHYVILLNDEPSVMHRFSQALSEILAANNGCGAVSLDFDCLLELPEYYLQAKDTLDFCRAVKMEAPLKTYQEMKVYLLLNEINPQMQKDRFYDTRLERLLDYDRQKGTQYFKTLYTYFKCALSRSATAKALFLHRNTVAYQLAKIQELLGMDLEDGEQCLSLYLSFKIREMQKMRRKHEDA